MKKFKKKTNETFLYIYSLAWYFYTDISAGSNGNFGGKTGRISDCRVCSFWKIVPVSQRKFVQSVQNQIIVKTRLVFPTKDQNSEILSGGFNDHFCGYWMYNDYSWSFECRVSTVPMSRGLYSMPKLREFVHNKSKTSFRIALHFWTNFKYSHRVSTSEIILRELTPESE